MISNELIKIKILESAIHGELIENAPDLKPIDVVSIKGEIPFNIPSNWKWCCLKDVAVIKTGNSINDEEKKNKYSNMNIDGLNYVATKDIDIYNNVNYENGIKIPQNCIDKFKIASSDSTLICIEGGSAGKKICYLSQNVCFVNKLCNLNSQIINNKYIYYFLQTRFFLTEFNDKKIGIIGGVSIKNLEKLLIPVPPIEEQNNIVNKIDKLFELVKIKEDNDNILLKLKNYLKEKILDNAIHGTLIKNDYTLEPINVEDIKNDIPFEIPPNWRWTTIDTISIVVRGGSPRPIKEYITDSKDGINWIKIGDTNPDDIYINHVKEKIKPSGMKKSRYVEKGSLLLTNSMSFGRPYILNVDGCIHDGWLNIKDRNQNYNNLYMVYLLSSKYFYNIMSDKSSGAVVSNLNIDKVKSILIPLPPLEEQKRIVEMIERLYKLIEQL